MSKIQVTVDLETLGRSDGAAIVQIAAIAFTKEDGLIDTFEANIDFDSVKDYEVEMDTVLWWLKQEKEAQEQVFESVGRIPFRVALFDLEQWFSHVSGGEEFNIWQHSSFDAPKINYAFRREFQRELRIKYNSFKDIRTLTEVTGVEKTPVTKGVAHNAMDDCFNQMNYILKCLRK